MNIEKSIQALDAYFKEEGNHPEVIDHAVKEALLSFAPICAHPNEMETKGFEKIGLALRHLSEIIDIINCYE